jgi:hypothetical protein
MRNYFIYLVLCFAKGGWKKIRNYELAITVNLAMSHSQGDKEVAPSKI